MTTAGARQKRRMLPKIKAICSREPEMQFGKLTAIFLYSNSKANRTKLPISRSDQAPGSGFHPVTKVPKLIVVFWDLVGAIQK